MATPSSASAVGAGFAQCQSSAGENVASALKTDTRTFYVRSTSDSRAVVVETDARGRLIYARVELQIGPALDSLRALPREPRFDLAFIDADKTGYAAYVEELLPRLRDGGVILVDNVLWGGSVVDPERQDGDTQAIRAFNDAMARDPRVDPVMIPLSDGLTLLRKRGEV